MKDGPFSPADLPVVNGRVYHLDLAPKDLAENVIIVGDPDRVPFIADEFFAEREIDRSHRGFRTITGRAVGTGQRISVVSSGIGTSSLEIVLNELVALNEINLNTRRRKKKFQPLNVIRIGTSGGLHPESEPGTLIVTDYVIGLDNTGMFYDPPCPDAHCRMLEVRAREAIAGCVDKNARFKGRIGAYAARANREIRVALEKEALHLGVRCRKGITVTSPGFFGSEGRAVARVPSTAQDLCSCLALMDCGIPGLKVENVEMEASFLLHFLGAIGYRAGVICAVIDKQSDGTFIADYAEHIRDATQVSLQVFRSLPPPGATAVE
jgi:uridine phosphorylase